MITTRKVFEYTTKTGRDLFDDIAELDKQQALFALKRPNTLAEQLDKVYSGLELIGYNVDEIDISNLLTPTIQEEEDEDDTDFVQDDYTKLINRTFGVIPKKTVRKVIISFINSGHIRSEFLLDSPFDVVMDIYNEAIKEHNKQFKKR